MVGGLVLGIVESLTASYISPGWSNFIVFGILLVALTARPQGLFGTRLAQ
jgi:branched-chain amino acid transport system permease protein